MEREVCGRVAGVGVADGAGVAEGCADDGFVDGDGAGGRFLAPARGRAILDSSLDGRTRGDIGGNSAGSLMLYTAGPDIDGLLSASGEQIRNPR